jgi:hypothetical protein
MSLISLGASHHSGSQRQWILWTIGLACLLLFATTPRAHAETQEECQRHIAHVDHELHEAIEHHGVHSREAEHQRHELHEARERCWREHHQWWDEREHRWHTQQDWDDRDHDDPHY